ncbi:phosphotransferase [Schaalia cardiffensis]|uniref:phosphotransferase n=1 Tax=Schaalia cardiffensis TaxID=181487 RepID=UPI0023EFB26F|nr:phosphotransferase [Schaalia cardiffensis]
MVPLNSAHEWPSESELLSLLLKWMPERRWFPLKGNAVPTLEELSIAVEVQLAWNVKDLLIAAKRPNEDAPVLIHVPLVLAAAEDLDSFASPGESAGTWGFVIPGSSSALVDGPHHPDFWRAWAHAALEAGSVMGAGAEAISSRADSGRVMTGEQSNTNVVMPSPHDRSDGCDSDIVVKLFRVLSPGRNPDVEVSAALAGAGWDRVRTPVAWSTLSWEDPLTHVPVLADSAVACVFIPKADDGFELFCELAHTDDVDGPIRARARALARELGETSAQMHVYIQKALGTATPSSPRELAASLRSRARWAMDEVGELEARIEGLRQRVEEVLSKLDTLDCLEPASRIHGDYHLGQVLREKEVPEGAQERWFVLDFEGEPLRPLAERSMPDQPMRDVAGMLRSFDYAAAVGKAADPTWLSQMRHSFLEGYTQASSPLNEEQSRTRTILLEALELDKALYEAVYEARNRPDWLAIPLEGISALLG